METVAVAAPLVRLNRHLRIRLSTERVRQSFLILHVMKTLFQLCAESQWFACCRARAINGKKPPWFWLAQVSFVAARPQPLGNGVVVSVSEGFPGKHTID